MSPRSLLKARAIFLYRLSLVVAMHRYDYPLFRLLQHDGPPGGGFGVEIDVSLGVLLGLALPVPPVFLPLKGGLGYGHCPTALGVNVVSPVDGEIVRDV